MGTMSYSFKVELVIMLYESTNISRSSPHIEVIISPFLLIGCALSNIGNPDNQGIDRFPSAKCSKALSFHHETIRFYGL